MLEQMRNMIKEAEEFRALMEGRYKDKTELEQIKALLVDILCLLHVEFYIRTQVKNGD